MLHPLGPLAWGPVLALISGGSLLVQLRVRMWQEVSGVHDLVILVLL